MNDDQFEDLKQFIDSRISQSEVQFDRNLKGVKAEMKAIKSKLEDLNLKIDTISEALHENLSKHDLRITKLEQQAV